MWIVILLENNGVVIKRVVKNWLDILLFIDILLLFKVLFLIWSGGKFLFLR